MKKLITALCLLITLGVKAQNDSAAVTIQWQARDIEYSGKYICDLPAFETMFDSLKLKFRVVTPPTGNTDVQVTAFAIDWMNLYGSLNSDVIAVHNNVTSRLKTLLLAASQSNITAYINNSDFLNQEGQSNGRVYGRFRLKKKK